MGLFFSNLHVRKTAEYDADFFRSTLTEILNAKGYVQKNNPDEADLSLSIYDAGGEWVSACSDGLEFYTEESIREICNPLSESLSADVLTVSCFDSDCLLLNRVNCKLGLNAWAKVGSYPEIKVRSAPAKWNGLIDDISQWKSILKRKYVFAEESLESIEPLLQLAPGQGHFCAEGISDEFQECVHTLYLSLPEGKTKQEPVRLTMPTYDLMPCEMGKSSFIHVVNAGGRSTGLAIAFSGDYVEREEIRFRDVCLEYGFDRHPRPTIPLQLEKRQTQNGKWIYYAEIPQFQILPGVKQGLPIRKSMEEEFKRSFGVRFTPEGNERKRLDITVHFIPLKNLDGQCGWCVWLYSGSKRAFIEQHNRTWSAHQPHGAKLLDAAELDIDE